MKALSIQQPWAWLIVQGHQDIENRTWSSGYRGRVLIHAGKSLDFDAFLDPRMARRAFRERWEMAPVFKRFGVSIQLPPLCDLPLGGFVGVATVVDCVRESESAWFTGPYGFVLARARAIEFVSYPGKLGFFEVPAGILKPEQPGLDWVGETYG